MSGDIRMVGNEAPLEPDRMASQEGLTQAIIESAIDGIITIDCKGIVHSFNAAAERIFGYGREEAIGRNISFLMPSPDREQHDGYLSRYLATREPRIIGIGRTVIGLRKDGDEVHIRLAVAPRILKLSCERQEVEGQCTINVEDNGKGIPDEYLDRLWESDFTTKVQGMGQGLSICRSILEGHDGELYAENTPDRGAVFRFTLPLAED